jgi:hypothetical protein
MILYNIVPTSPKLEIGNIQYNTVGSNLSCFGKNWLGSVGEPQPIGGRGKFNNRGQMFAVRCTANQVFFKIIIIKFIIDQNNLFFQIEQILLFYYVKEFIFISVN